MTRPEGQRRLADRLSDGAPELAAFRATIRDVDRRRSLLTPLAKETRRKYEFWLKAYLKWRTDCKLQPTLTGTTDETLGEFVISLTERDAPYDPRSIKQALSALKYWAERAAVDPQPSFRAPYAVLAEYERVLAAEGLVAPRKKRARRPTVGE